MTSSTNNVTGDDLFRFPNFINCSQSLCEVQQGFFGSSVGVCNQVTQLCQCPPGYGGADVWGVWNDCHIDLALRDGIDYAQLALALASLTASILGLLTLLVKWGIISWPTQVEFESSGNRDSFQLASPPEPKRSSTVPPPTPQSGGMPSPPLPLVLSPTSVALHDGSSSSPGNPKRKSRGSLMPKTRISELFVEPRANGTNSFQQLQAEQKRRRTTLGVLLTWFIFGLALFVFALVRVLYKVRIEERNHWQLLALGTALFTSILALWLQAYAWFSNLPSLRLFAGMFPSIKNNLLVKYPFLFRNILIVNSIVFGSLCYITCWILPAFTAFVDRGLASLIFTIGALELVFFTFLSNAVSMILLNLFSTFESGDLANGGAGGKKFTQGKLTVKTMVVLTTVAGPFLAVWMLILAWNEYGFRYTILFFAGLFFSATLASLVSTYIFVFRMSGVRNESPRHRSGTSSLRNNAAAATLLRQSKRTSQA